MAVGAVLLSCSTPEKEDAQGQGNLAPPRKRAQSRERPELVGSPPPLSPYFRLEPAEKNAYLSLYPWLNPDERNAALAEPLKSLVRWSQERKDSGELLKASDPKRIQGLEIEAIPRLRSLLVYAGGKKVEATQETLWAAGPPHRVSIENRVLRIQCSSLPTSVTGTFFDVATRTVEIPPPSRITRILLRRSDALNDAWENPTHEYLQLELTAFCADGSQGNVSCEAEWSIDSPKAEINSCGRLHFQSGARHLPLRAQAHIGNFRAEIVIPPLP